MLLTFVFFCCCAAALLPAYAHAAGDTAPPKLQVTVASSPSSTCAVQTSPTEITVATRDCSTDLTVTATAYDDFTTSTSTTGLSRSDAPDAAGVSFGDAPSYSGAQNWSIPAGQYHAGAPLGLETTCWATSNWSGMPDGTGIDDALDYDAEAGLAGFNHSSVDDPSISAADAGAAAHNDPFSPASLLIAAPSTTAPYSDSMSCRWHGFVLARGAAGNYDFSLLNDDTAAMSIGADDQTVSPPAHCPALYWSMCDLLPHAATWSTPLTANFPTASTALPIDVVWSDASGLSALGLAWRPPAGGDPLQNEPRPGFEAVPAGAFVANAIYSATYHVDANANEPDAVTFTIPVSARDGAGNIATAHVTVHVDNSPMQQPAELSMEPTPDTTANGRVDVASATVSKLDAGSAGTGRRSVIEARQAAWDSVNHVCAPTANALSTVDTPAWDPVVTQRSIIPVTEGCWWFQYVQIDAFGRRLVSPIVPGAVLTDTSTWLVVTSDTGVASTTGSGTSGDGSTSTGGSTDTPAGPSGTSGGGATTTENDTGSATTNTTRTLDAAIPPQRTADNQTDTVPDQPTVTLGELGTATRATAKSLKASWQWATGGDSSTTWDVEVQITPFGVTPSRVWTPTRRGLTDRSLVLPKSDGGTTTCVRVRAIYADGKSSRASAPACWSAPLAAGAMRSSRAGTWSIAFDGRGASRTRVRVSKAVRAELHARLAGTSAVVNLRGCATCGQAVMLVNGKAVRTINTRGRGAMQVLVLLPGSGLPVDLAIRATSGAPVRVESVSLDR